MNNQTAIVQVRVPVRIDFAGGWSDAPDFVQYEEGAAWSYRTGGRTNHEDNADKYDADG